jgi:hypothetical protein
MPMTRRHAQRKAESAMVSLQTQVLAVGSDCGLRRRHTRLFEVMPPAAAETCTARLTVLMQQNARKAAAAN